MSLERKQELRLQRMIYAQGGEGWQSLGHGGFMRTKCIS